MVESAATHVVDLVYDVPACVALVITSLGPRSKGVDETAVNSPVFLPLAGIVPDTAEGVGFLGAVLNFLKEDWVSMSMVDLTA